MSWIKLPAGVKKAASPGLKVKGSIGGAQMTPQLAAYLQSLGGGAPEEEPTDDVQYIDDGGGYSDGGGVAAAPRYDPNSDPSYLAMLANLGLQEDAARTDSATKTRMAQESEAIATPRVAEQGIETRRGIDTNYEGRGLYRSGDRLRALAIQRRGEDQRLADLRRGTAGQVAGIQSELQQRILDLGAKRASAAFEATARASGV